MPVLLKRVTLKLMAVKFNKDVDVNSNPERNPRIERRLILITYRMKCITWTQNLRVY